MGAHRRFISPISNGFYSWSLAFEFQLLFDFLWFKITTFILWALFLNQSILDSFQGVLRLAVVLLASPRLSAAFRFWVRAYSQIFRGHARIFRSWVSLNDGLYWRVWRRECDGVELLSIYFHEIFHVHFSRYCTYQLLPQNFGQVYSVFLHLLNHIYVVHSAVELRKHIQSVLHSLFVIFIYFSCWHFVSFFC